MLVKGTSSAFTLAGIWGSSTRELAINEYPSNRFFTPGSPGDGDLLSPEPRPLCSTSIKSSSRHFSVHIEIPNTPCRTVDRFGAMGTKQQSGSSSSHGQGSSPTEGDSQTLPKSVGGTSTSTVRQGVAGAQQDTTTSSSNSSSMILAALCRSFSDVPPDRRFHPPVSLSSGTQHARWKYHTQLAKMGFDETLDLTADIYIFELCLMSYGNA